MKPTLSRVILEPGESFTCKAWRRPSKEIHAESVYFSGYTLLLNLRGRGMRYIGDHVERYQKGDLVMVGPNLPQAWVSDDLPMCHSISSTFDENFLGAEGMALPEMAEVRSLLALARRGVAFPPAVARQIAPAMMRMSRAKKGERLWLLLSILDRLATAPGRRLIASEGFSLALNASEASRLALVCRYIQQSYQGKIEFRAAAKLAGLSPSAFSRFFHRRMGRTFKAYVTEVRVGQACHQLLEQDSTIARIAYETGFNNLSNFNLSFRQLKGMSPREFRRLNVPTAVSK